MKMEGTVKSEITCAVVGRPYPGKNHDRSFVDRWRNIYSVFDGAAHAEASDLAVLSLMRIARSSLDFNVVDAMSGIQSNLLNTFSGRYLTTGSILHLTQSRDGMEAHFACAGDSPIYRYDHASSTLRRETVDESERLGSHIDAHNFLGNSRHVLQQTGKIAIATETTFLIVSDGITDEYYPGYVRDEAIAEILAIDQSVDQSARMILDRAAEFDDATVLVAKVTF